MDVVLHNLNHGLMITVFVFVMMMLVDYIEVLTQGRMSKAIKGGYFRQYVMASALASTPGCLGSFMNVSFYVHGFLTFGAIAGSMIATCGDGAFVMLALMPQKAFIIFGILFILGIFSAWVIDKLSPILGIRHSNICVLSDLHIGKECRLLNLKGIIEHLKKISLSRFLLLSILFLFIYLIFLGVIGIEKNWLRTTLLVMLLAGIFIVITVPEHYLEEHIWQHIAKKHIWRVFLWTFFALLLVDIGLENEKLRIFIEQHKLWVLLIAALIAIIPESGPHFVFVMMFCEGVIPFSVLLTSAIIQDGHGMLPLLSYTIKDALLIKAINLLIGLMCGLILYMVGF
jgi:hypothetical protein